MFTILTTWISERIITITAVSVLTVAAVPTTLIIVSNHDDHNTVAVIQPADLVREEAATVSQNHAQPR